MKAYKKLLVMFLMASTALTYSCGDKDDDIGDPTLTVQQDPNEAAPGQVVVFTVNASSDPNANLKSLKIEEVIPGQTQAGLLKDTTVSGKSIVNYAYRYTVPQGATGTKTVRFTVTDNGNRTKVETKTVTVTGTAATKIYTARLLGAQENATTGSFFATDEGIVYKVAEAKSNAARVDFVFFYGATNKATIAAPSNTSAAQFTVFQLATWSKRNATMFKKTNAAAYDNSNTSQDLVDAYSTASGSAGADIANELSTGNVVAFKTEAGKYGVFKVTNLDARNNGSITFDVKVQP